MDSENTACANKRFLGLNQKNPEEIQQTLEAMVASLAELFEKHDVNACRFKPCQLACLAAYHALFVRGKVAVPKNGLARWCWGLKPYIPGDLIEPEGEEREHLASQCLPRHYDDSGTLQPAGKEQSCQAIATAPVTCELCHVGLAGHDMLARHCRLKHKSLAEYRKRAFYKAREAGPCPQLPWVKRNIAQGFQFFRLHSVPSSFNDYTMKATKKAELRREEACAVCTVKDWLENRHEVYLFKEGTRFTTWKEQFYGREDEGQCDEDDGGRASASASPQSPQGTLVIDDDGTFCVGPKHKIHGILDVQRYAALWPLIPVDELHASSVQHPDDVDMRWLLHSRRVKCTPPESIRGSLPRSAGIGDKGATAWCCK